MGFKNNILVLLNNHAKMHNSNVMNYAKESSEYLILYIYNFNKLFFNLLCEK